LLGKTRGGQHKVIVDGSFRFMLNLKEATTRQIAYTSSGTIDTRPAETWAAADLSQNANISSGIVFTRHPSNSIASLIGLDEFEATLDDLNDRNASWTTLDT
jgi:hypothetical protein